MVLCCCFPLLFSLGPIEFIEPDFSALPPPAGTPDMDKKDFPVIEKPKKEGGGYILSCAVSRRYVDSGEVWIDWFVFKCKFAFRWANLVVDNYALLMCLGS